MLIDVANRFCADSGYNFPSQREIVLDILQRSADEIYKILECNNIYREVTLVVPPDKIVSLPAFVGEIRGCRAHTPDMQFDVYPLASPRYVNQTWQYRIKNWREMAESPILRQLDGVAPLTIVSEVIEAEPAVLTIVGQTDKAARTSESVTLDSSPEVTTNNFGLEIMSISCRSLRTGNITILDSDGDEVAVLLNTQNSTRYRLVDVSQVFWSQDTSEGSTLVDFLYKVSLGKFQNDADVFYAGDNYDDAWYYYAMYLYYNTKPNSTNEAVKFYQQAITACNKDKMSAEGQDIKKLSFGRNKFYNLFGAPGNYYEPYSAEYPFV